MTSRLAWREFRPMCYKVEAMRQGFRIDWARAVLAGLAAAAFSGCVFQFGASGDSNRMIRAREQSRSIDLYGHESRTLSNLAVLEQAVGQYVSKEGRPPGKLEDLVPRYLAEMPTVELGHPEFHFDTTYAQNYDPRILKNGIIDGSMLEDTGRWGYVRDGVRGVVFVDCTHPDSRNRPWFREKGAF